MRIVHAALLLFLELSALGCSGQPQKVEPAAPTPTQSAKPQIQLTSSAFKNGQAIPRQYTCDGIDISPPLEWKSLPKTAKTIALIADDPDAPSGTFVHWVLYNLPAENIGLVENVPPTETIKGGGIQGKNGQTYKQTFRVERVSGNSEGAPDFGGDERHDGGGRYTPALLKAKLKSK